MAGRVDRWLGAGWPRGCLLCRQPAGGRGCCPGCRTDLPWLQRPCRVCGRELAADYPDSPCTACLVKPPPFTIRSALHYGYPLDRLIAAAKFRGRLDCAAELGELLADGLEATPSEPADLIVPVPLHRWRLAMRGYNQAEAVAGPVGRRFGLPVRPGCCRRIRATAEQSGLSGAARRRNPAGAFAAARELGGESIAVVDDVLTTGSTAAAVARCLLEAGAARVMVWTVARAGD